jgi:HD-GYP domain-containing protein (c-di-GMP phosphodiesterase class II)
MDPKDKANLRKLNEDGKRFVYRVATLLRTARIYSLDNQAMTYSLNVVTTAANRLVDRFQTVNLVGEGDTIHLNDYRIRVDRGMVPQIRFFNEFMHKRGIGGFKIDGSLQVEDWKRTLQVLMDTKETSDKDFDSAAHINAKLGDLGVAPLRVAPVMRLQRGTLGNVGGGEGDSIRVAASRSLHAYVRAVRAVDAMQSRLRSGRGHPGLSRIVQHLVELAFDEPRSYLALVQLKDQGNYEQQHPVNTCILAIAMGQRLGLTRGSLLDLGMAAMACDMGMVEVEDELRAKKNPLLARDHKLIEQHPIDSARVCIRGARMDLAVQRRTRVAFEHHMGFDHSGYPSVLEWGELHLFTRIYAVAESYDALTTTTTWRDGLLPDEALAEMMEDVGTRLDPALVSVFVNLVGRYPLGSTVLLSSGEVGVVYMTPSESKYVRRPVVKLLLDRQGNRVTDSRLIDLRDQDDAGRYLCSVARTVDPDALGVDVNRALYG